MCMVCMVCFVDFGFDCWDLIDVCIEAAMGYNIIILSPSDS